MPGIGREKSSPPQLIRFYRNVLGVFAVDQFSKMLALRHLDPSATFPLISGIFHLTLVQNTGIAFGFFRGGDWILLTLITVSLLVLAGMSFYLPKLGPGTQTALALILGGALGNWLDRVRLGAVVDFLDFQIWPVFNLADTAISIGVGIYLLQVLRTPKNL